MQQDGQVAVCAATAVWMVSRLMQLRFGFQWFSLPGITRAANRYLRINREFPAIRGLTLEQIVSGFFELGFTPICYQRDYFRPKSNWNPKEIIYKYIESGLPVIAIIGGSHACVVVGHDFNRGRLMGERTHLLSTSALIDNFLVHDDMRGPYLLMPEHRAVTKGAAKFEFKKAGGSRFSPFKDKPNFFTPYSVNDITSIIIPTFRKVYLERQQIEDLIRDFFDGPESFFRQFYLGLVDKQISFEDFSPETTVLVRKMRDALKNSSETIYYRTRFLLSNLFKEDYLLKKDGVSAVLAMRYARLSLPRYLWVAEVSLKEQVIGRNSAQKNFKQRVVGELVFDATGPDDIISLVAVHLPGFLIVNPLFDASVSEEGEKESTFAYPVFDDQPYDSFDRRRLATI